MQNNKIIVGITQGDSNGIGYEVIIKALADPRILEQFTPVIYGSPKLFGFYRKTIPEVEQMDTNVIRRVTIESDHPFHIAIDGELLSGTHFEVENMHRRLLFAIPQKQ